MNNFDTTFLKDIEINKLERYLIDDDWKKIALKKKINFLIYQKKISDKLYQINVPLHKDYSDYEDMMYRICLVLADCENTSVERIIEKLNYLNSDIIKIRVSNSSVINGTLPFEEAVKFIEQSKKLVADAAMDVLEKSKHRVARYSNEVAEFMSKCRFGQTEVGSYVLSIICPFDEEKNKTHYENLFSEDFKEENKTRRIVKKLLKSTQNIADVIEKDGDLLEFVNRNDDDFISLNFIEDLGSLFEDDNSVIEIKSQFNALSKDNELLKPSIFRMSNSKKLKHFVDSYKLNEKPFEENVKLYGLISRVSADPVLETRSFGEVSIEVKSEKKTYKLLLGAEDYADAVEAHQKGWEVFVEGQKRDDQIECRIFKVFKIQSLF